MGNPVFKFTLSQTKPRTLREVYPLSGWTNEGIALQTDWTTGEFPFVTLADGGTADRLRKTSISGVTAGDKVLSYSITSTKTAFHVARVRFEKAGVDVSQMLPDTHGLDPIEIPLVNGTAVGTVNIRLSDIPDEVLITVVDPGGGGGSTTTVNYLDMALTDGTESMVISEPDGWKDAKLKMERHPDYHSLVEYFEGSFIFYGENNVDNGRADFIKVAEQQYGPCVDINILIEADIDGDGVYEETIFDGQLDLTGLKEVADNKIQVPIIRNDLWAKFIARRGMDVNLRSTRTKDGEVISAAEIVDLNLTSQIITKRFDGHLLDTRVFTQDDVTTSDYIQLDVDTYILDEFEEKFTLLIIDNPEVPQSLFSLEDEGTYEFDLRVEVSVFYYELVGSTSPGCELELQVTGSTSYLEIYIQINDETPIAFTKTSSPLILDDISTIYTYTGTRTLKKGDQIRIYGDVTANISSLGEYAQFWIYSKNNVATIYEPTLIIDPDPPNGCTTFGTPDIEVTANTTAPSGEEIPTYFRIVADTTYPDSTAQGFLIHDAAAAIIKLIVGDDLFRSEYIGSTQTMAHQYDSDGCAWKNVILQGLQLRGYDIGDKQFSMSFDKLWKCISPLLFLGLTYDDFNGTESIIIDRIDAFFDASAVSVNLSNVRQISRKYDASRLYNQVETGFNKWQSENVQGIDDVQTKRKWGFDPSKFDKGLSIISEAITASTAIEATRRKTIEKSEDYKYDNEPFIIAINGNGVSPDRYLPELDENFNSITGIRASEKRYNFIHTPLRMLLRWAKWWNGPMQKYQNDVVEFDSGEGNYNMVSDYSCTNGDQCLAVICDPISESTDINLASYGRLFGYLHLPQLYTIEVINFTWDDYLAIRNNRHLAIGISQTLSNYKRFFIKELIYEVCKGKASITAWPYDETPIDVVETVQPDEIDEDGEDGFDADYQAILDYATSQGYTLPSSAQQALQNQLILDLKAADIWSDLDILYIFATDGNEAFARINWINPSTFYVTPSGSPTFTADQGYSGNATNQWLNLGTLGWRPFTNAVKFTQDDGAMFCHINNSIAATAGKTAFGSMGPAGSGRTELQPNNAANQHGYTVNSATLNATGSTVNSQGFYHILRVAGPATRLFKNGSQVGSDGGFTSQTKTAAPLTLLALNNNGTVQQFSDYQISVFGAGASLSGKESALYTAWNDYFTSL